MKTWMKTLLGVALSFMCVFSCIGYAALSDTLGIRGTAKTDIPEGLFITEISTDTTNRVYHQSVSYLQYTTKVDSTIDRSSYGA